MADKAADKAANKVVDKVGDKVAGLEEAVVQKTVVAEKWA